MSTRIRNLEELLDKSSLPDKSWRLKIISSQDCVSYVAWNEKTKEALLIDPKDTDINAYRNIHKELSQYLWIAIIDTHTHADHISAAAVLSEEFKIPLIMHQLSLSQRVHLKVNKDTEIQTQSAPIKIFHTPGHTPDSLAVFWGPFIFSGDTILYGDVGRDDLPGGNAKAHYESLQKIKENAEPSMILLPGHDGHGGRPALWSSQLKENSSLTQARESFIQEAEAYKAPAPALLKESLKENFQ